MGLRKDYNQAETSAVLDKNARESWKKAQEKRKKEKEASKKTETKSKTSFGTAFANARKAGQKTFMWNGKSYTTKRADDKPAAKPTAKPTAESTRAPGSENYKPMNTNVGPNMKAKAAKKTVMDKMKDAIGMNRPATEREQMGRDLQKKAIASMGIRNYKKGGSVKAHRGDGICKKGRTKGRMR